MPRLRAPALPYVPFLAAGLLVLHLCAGVAAQAPPASVSGRVVNGTLQYTPVTGAAISLFLLDTSGSRPVASTSADANGHFEFGNLQSGAGLSFIASVSYLGVTYHSDPVEAQAGRDLVADVIVYDATSDVSELRIRRLSIVPAGVDASSGLISIVESYRLRNAATTTFVGDASGGQRRTLIFPLFQGARNLTPLDGFSTDDAVTTGNGFALTSPVLPGDSTVSFSYALPFEGRSIALRRTLSYPTDLAEVIRPTSIAVTSPQLTSSSSVQLGSQRFDTLQAIDLTAGSAFVLNVSGLPSHADRTLNAGSLPFQAAVIALIVAAVGSTAVYRRRSGHAERGELTTERAALIRVVADLDDSAERGDLDEAARAGRRQEAMNRLQMVESLLREGRLPRSASDSPVRASRRPR